MAAAKKTMTLNLTDAEMAALEELCEKKDLSKTSVVRQALRLYQLIEARMEKGDKLFFEDEKTKQKAEVMML
ncbi:putative transcriptional regulator [Pseudomonas fluvialis]|jgi:predicted transcriptional regulator|uniref:Putative transcriptional regulator n=1 Tax=Pseudomonas fluvialis TaxID=1793966 RepID=A0A7X0BQE8_9PSED|nr:MULTISPECIES: ribbon-helix-helix protein, CopG family [Pseudomonas]AYF88160.1 ribbon-helix-helix protein, CopG family [Pseudomonas sp. DY-1]MBB6340523.1 putative transcriptional regulator [Pseudomonas fluvialis]